MEINDKGNCIEMIEDSLLTKLSLKRPFGLYLRPILWKIFRSQATKACNF